MEPTDLVVLVAILVALLLEGLRVARGRARRGETATLLVLLLLLAFTALRRL